MKEIVHSHKRKNRKGRWIDVAKYTRKPKPKAHKGVKRSTSIGYVDKEGNLISKRVLYRDNQGRLVSKGRT